MAGRQKTEVRGRKSEVGSQRSEVRGHLKLIAHSSQLKGKTKGVLSVVRGPWSVAKRHRAWSIE